MLAFKEALHNIRKHARASHVTIRVTEDAGRLTLDITDDGVGFDASAARHGGLGLGNLRQRAEKVGGALRIERATAGGTRVVFTARLNLRTSK